MQNTRTRDALDVFSSLERLNHTSGNSALILSQRHVWWLMRPLAKTTQKREPVNIDPSDSSCSDVEMFENCRVLFVTKIEADFVFEFASCFNKAILE